jgi:SAM-dependent methyltransferase
MTETGFSAEWLDLREPADARARARGLTQAVTDTLPTDRVVTALDLACGTGSNARYLSEFVRSPQQWVLADHSPALLQVARERLGERAETRLIDLARLDHQPDLFRGCDLVTASALLDLVSDAWLLHALSRCREANTTVLFALSYDGRMLCTPEEPGDALVCELVNRHQRTDKGFGPARGPSAAATAAATLDRLGYRVLCEESDWRLGAGESDLQRLLIEGWADAASEMAPERAQAITAWRTRRLQHLAEGRSRLLVGHQDVAGLLTSR